jgi:hypothetical protein
MDLYPGLVAIYDDGTEHAAVILTVTDDQCEALFFTSNPGWAEASRRASKEELAMAGYITTRTTYLAYVVRPKWYFVPTDREFSRHWTGNLHEEFLTQRARVTQGSRA